MSYLEKVALAELKLALAEGEGDTGGGESDTGGVEGGTCGGEGGTVEVRSNCSLSGSGGAWCLTRHIIHLGGETQVACFHNNGASFSE